MKQNIRLQTFETNSSSYHTLSIIKKTNNNFDLKTIEKGKDLIIDTYIPYKKLHYTESYNFVARTNYEKAQLCLRFLASEIENQIDDLSDDSFYKVNGKIDYLKMHEYEKQLFSKTKIVQAFVKAIKRYIGEDKNVKIEFSLDWSPFIHCVTDEAKDVVELFGLKSHDDLESVSKLSNILYKIIFDDKYQMTEECESNE